jgi:transposase
MAAEFLTVRQVAARYGINPSKVIYWIRTGALRGVNIAHRHGGRPRWRISSESLAEFEAARSATPPIPTPRRRRRTGRDGVTQYV